MNKLLTFFLITLLFPGMYHKSNAQPLSGKQETAIKSQVNTLFREMISYAEKLNYDKLGEGVDDRYHAGFLVAGNYYTDYDSLIVVLKPGLKGLKKQRIEINSQKITVLSDHTALLTATGISTAELTDGRTFDTKFLWSFVYEKFDGDWKVIQSHQSQE